MREDYLGDNSSLSGDWSDLPEEENSQLEGDSSGESSQLQGDLPEEENSQLRDSSGESSQLQGDLPEEENSQQNRTPSLTSRHPHKVINAVNV